MLISMRFANIDIQIKVKCKIFTGSFIVPFLILLCLSSSLFACQVPIYEDHNIDTVSKISLHNSKPDKKRFGRAALQLGFAELIPWTYDRYVARKDYAVISLKTIGHNFNPKSWTWDNDNFHTNQFGHPYHGSYFFSAYRSNGYSFWEAVPAAFAGSYIWETAAENQYPAPNDFINTSFGGIVLGEMTYRLSNKVVNNHTRGFKRQASEVLGFLINPMNGLTRIMDGKWGRVSSNPQEPDSSRIYAEFDLGLRKFSINNHDGRFGWYGHIKLLYGTPYEDYKTAFSNISINTEFGKDDSSKVNVVSVYGSLLGWHIRSADNLRHLAVLSANYDYIHNTAFFYSAQSVKFNFISEYGLFRKFKLSSSFGAGPVLLGAVPDHYLYNGRNYDYGAGFAMNAGGGFNLANKLFYTFNYRGGWLRTINGNKSHYFLHAVSSELRYMFIENVSVCAEPGYFNLRGYYKDYDDVSINYPYLRVSVRYSLNIR